MVAEVSLDKLWQWWRELAGRELRLEGQYKPLIAEYQMVHNKRMALENLMAQGQVATMNQQISAEFEKLRKGEELPSIEQKPTDAVYDVLSRNAKPMHYKTILAEINKSGIIVGGRDPGTTLIVYLGRDKRFAKAREVGRGLWKLSEWEQTDVGGINMECPSCHRYSGEPKNVAMHIMNLFDESHVKWLVAEGFNPPELVRTGNYGPLIAYLAKMAVAKH